MVISHKSAQNHTKSPYPAPHKACRFYQAARTPPRIDHYPTYRALLTEGVSLRDIVTIATVLVASSTVTKDHILLAADVRLALRRSITHPFVRKQELTVYTLNNELENLLTNVVNQAQQGGKVMLDSVPVDPNMLNQFQSTMPQVKEQMKAAGKDPVLLVPPQLRPLLARYARLFAPGLHVLSYNEVPDELELKIMGALM